MIFGSTKRIQLCQHFVSVCQHQILNVIEAIIECLHGVRKSYLG